ncbi:MAG TPA: hypothetical protein VFU71_00565 [Burkholderiaceae bacterium]|nr:hypothetical protein [Burkholderiaceae bacterium]
MDDDATSAHRSRSGASSSGLTNQKGIRIALAACVGLVFVGAAFITDEPLILLVGTLPIAWVAVEFCWVASGASRDRDAS